MYPCMKHILCMGRALPGLHLHKGILEFLFVQFLCLFQTRPQIQFANVENMYQRIKE